ncbi:MAG: type II secretion system protein GspC [Xanthomonadaceae bacterium]|nr:type II secretion system protein GspC [Xanthomonadaceae bacterium]
MNDSIAIPLRRFQARLRESGWLDRLPVVVSVALVILIAWTAAGLTWSLLSPQAPAAGPVAMRAGPAEPMPDPDRIASRSLFGSAEDAPVQTTIDAPETRLNLTLRGISASADAAYARAVIAGSDGKERVYAARDEVPGGAVVHEIHADRVILNRRGTLETLRLPRLGSDSPVLGSAASRPLTPVAVDNLRDQAATEQMAEIIRPQAVMVGGQLRGYRVYPGRDRQRFAALGLRAGDLVTAIDGIPLNDPARGLEAMQVLTGSQEAVVTVERGDQTETVTVRAVQ